MCLLGATAHRNWLLGHLHLQVPMQAPCHLSLQQTNVLPILVMKKCKLRAGKGFIQGVAANHHPQCTCTCKLPPHPELSGGTLAPTTKMLAWGPLHQLQRLKQLSGKLSKPFLSFPLVPGRSRWSQPDRREIYACSQQRQVPRWGESSLSYPRDNSHGPGRRWPFQGVGEEPA